MAKLCTTLSIWDRIQLAVSDAPLMNRCVFGEKMEAARRHSRLRSVVRTGAGSAEAAAGASGWTLGEQDYWRAGIRARVSRIR